MEQSVDEAIETKAEEVEHVLTPKEYLAKKKQEANPEPEERLLKPSELMKTKEDMPEPEESKEIQKPTAKELPVKPSDVYQKAMEEKYGKDEKNLKPSELIKSQDSRFGTPESTSKDTLKKPSEIAKQGVIQRPAQPPKKYDPVITDTRYIDGDLPNHIERKDGETDEEYKERVKDTLQEVVSLLEKLLD